jgi:hypothetical protein
VRLYDVAVASLAIDAPRKWVDNLLSHHDVPDILSARRGVSRRIPHSALLLLALTRSVHVDLGMSVRDALRLAATLLAGGEGAVHESGHLRVTFDRSGLERTVRARLGEALESAPTPRRGRPRARAATR